MEPYCTLLGEGIRQITPSSTACRLGCSSHCRHEQDHFDSRTFDDSNVIPKLSSNWIEPNSVLAIARPSEPFLLSHVIAQFHQRKIRSVINLQRRGEHEYCGTLVDGAFTYKPETFMNADISYYNFPTDDFGIWDVDHLLDIIKVVSFAVSEGGVAIHCHAGLGRTGVICACWLIFDRGMYAEEAIRAVRANRAGSIQTRQQLASVINFESIVKQLRAWPAGEVSINHLYRCYKKGYNKHEFGRNPGVPPLLLKIRHILSTKTYDQKLDRTMEDWVKVERIKVGFWYYLQYINKDTIEQLVRSWIGGLSEPLINSSVTAEYNQVITAGLELDTARVAYEIMIILDLNKNEILSLLSHNQNADERLLECLQKT